MIFTDEYVGLFKENNHYEDRYFFVNKNQAKISQSCINHKNSIYKIIYT